MNVFQRGFNAAFAARHCKHGIRKIRRLERTLPDAATRFAVPFVYRGHGLFEKIAPWQSSDECNRLYQRVIELNPKRVLELGTKDGGTLYLWAQAATDDAVLVSVDLPGGKFGGGYPQAREQLYTAFAGPGQAIHLLRSDSHLPQTRERAAGFFDGEPIDFLFIDGDHSYEGVKADFEQYAPLVRPGGLIGFHDVLAQPKDPQNQVQMFWDQIKDRHPSEEIAEQRSGFRPLGIGIITVPPQGLAAWA